MSNDQAKAHHVGEWATLRDTFPEIAEAIFEVANYDEKLAEEIWRQQGNDDVLFCAFDKTDADVLTWDDTPVERKNI